MEEACVSFVLDFDDSFECPVLSDKSGDKPLTMVGFSSTKEIK